MTNKLKQIFAENADCYFTMEMQSAMTETKFIEVVSELMQQRDIDATMLSTKINYINQK